MTPQHLPRTTGIVLAFTLAVAACGDETITEPANTSLVGSWTLIGFTDGERVAESSGNWVFFDDGLMATDLSFTFPDEETIFLATIGDYEQLGDHVTLIIRGDTSAWSLEFTPTDVVMEQTAPDPADNTIRLQRR